MICQRTKAGGDYVVERIWMHVGAEKTGTTTLQHWLMKNRGALRRQNRVLFPKAPGKFNHIALAAYALNDTKGMEELRITCGANQHPSVTAFRTSFETDLAEEIAQATPRDIVFSNEHCSSRLRTPEEIARLRDLLHRFSKDVRIVLYIREPGEFFTSWYSTMIASGGVSAFPAQPGPDLLKAADWLSVVQMWSGMFGPDAITVRRFTPTHLVGGDLIHDFCSVLGLPADRFDPVQTRNESMGLVPLLFLRKLNASLPRIKDGAFNQERGNIVPVLRSFPDPRRFTIPAAAARQIRDHYAESYDALRQMCFPDETGPLFPEPNIHPNTASADSLSEDDMMAITRHLWINRRKKFT